MSRQRFIYPETFASDDFVALSLGARLMFIGLFSTADDFGRGKGSVGALKATIFPMDELPREQIGTWAEEIRKRKMVRFYEVDGSIYYEVAKWDKWQRPKYKVASKIPPFQDKAKLRGRLIPEAGTNQPGDRATLGNGLGSDGLGRDGLGGEGSVGLGVGSLVPPAAIEAREPLPVSNGDPDPEPDAGEGQRDVVRPDYANGIEQLRQITRRNQSA